MNLNIVRILFKKEILELLRDRRALITFASMIFGFPLLYIGIIGVTINKAQEDSQKSLSIDVVNQGSGSDIVSFLKTMNVSVNDVTAYDEKQFTQSKNSVLLLIPEQFKPSALAKGGSRSSLLKIYVDGKEKDANQEGSRLEKIIQAYGHSIAVRRLYIRGVNPQLLEAVKVQTIQIDENSSRLSMLLSLLGAILTIACFMTTIYMSVDIVAGEKARNSLEPLLLTPNSRLNYLLPKFLTILLMILVAVVLSSVFYVALIHMPQFQDFIGMTLSVSTKQVVYAITLFTPLAFLGSSIQLYLSTIGKSVKEAQGYTSLVGVVFMMPSLMAGQLFSNDPGAIKNLPGISQSLILEKIMVGKVVSLDEIGVSVGITLGLAVVFMYLTLTAFRSQKIFEQAAQ